MFFMRGVKVGNPEQARWAHLALSGTQDSLHIAHSRCQLCNK